MINQAPKRVYFNLACLIAQVVKAIRAQFKA